MISVKRLTFVGLIAVAMIATTGSSAFAGHHHNCCAPVCCECPPPPVTQTLCVVDPCTCCTYNVCVTLPPCCGDQPPCLAGWRWGIFGRKVLTYEWPCGYCVDVVITKRGRTIVRG